MNRGDPTERDEGTVGGAAPRHPDLAEPIAGRYQVEAQIGAGGMGVVYRARDLERGGLVAVKLVRVGYEGSTARERFEREITALAAVVHPGVVGYLEHGTNPDGTTHLVMELVEGHDLARRLTRGRLSIDEVLDLADRVAAALVAAHAAGVVHRDLKPSNILLAEGVIAHAKLLDFGVARLSGLTGLTATGHVLGTPGYMSPEQARGDADVDGRADIYSLGCVLFECLTGDAPFPGAHAMAVLAKVLLEDTPRVAGRLTISSRETAAAVALDQLIHSMMARDRAHRPSSPTELRVRLEQARAGMYEAAPIDYMAPTLSHDERRVLSVLFAGWPTANGPTATPEPSVLADVARRAGEAIGVDVIELADGSVIGSFPLAGTPTDQAEQAARCALVIRAGQPSVPIILASGHGVVGHHSLIGDVIDRGAELMHLARPGEIRLDEPTSALLEPIALLDYDDDGARLQGLRTSAEPLRTLLGQPTPFVGRASELAAIEAVIQECIAEPCANAVLVLGEPGVGKSRLRYELVRRVLARVPDLEVLLGRADPVGGAAAYGLLARALRAAAGVRPGESPEQQAVRLDEYLLAGSDLAAPVGQRIQAFLAELAGVTLESRSAALESARANPKLMREAISDAWEVWLTDRCQRRGVLLVLEDLHWGDAGTIDLVDCSLAALDRLPFIVLALARPEVDQRFPSLWSAVEPRRVELEPLTRRAARKLAARVLGDAGGFNLDAMVERSGGNAFYLEELLRAAARGDERLPDTIVGMVQSRLAQLEPQARRLLRAGAVFGEICWSGGVARLVAESEHTIARQLDELAVNEFLTRRPHSTVPETNEYTFRHALMRDSVYATLTADDRRVAHGLAGRWLESVGVAEAVVLAHHYRLGEQYGPAVVWFERAATSAVDVEDYVRAIKLVEYGIECGAEKDSLGRLHALLARIAEESGEHDRAIDEAGIALALMRERSQSWHAALAILLESFGRTSRFEEIQPWLERALTGQVEQDALSACVSVAALGATHLCKAGQLRLAREYAGRSRELACCGSVNPVTRLRVLELEHELADMAGDLGRMLESLAQLADVIEVIDAPSFRARHASACGHLFAQLGANELAEAGFEVERAYAIRKGLRYRLFGTLGMLAVLAFRRGDLEAAAELLSQARAAETPDQRFIGVLCGLGSALALAQGDLKNALAEARKSEIALRVARPLHPYGLATLANASLARGDLDEAMTCVTRAMAIIDDLGSVSEIEVDVQVAYVEILLAVGRREHAREALQRFKVRFDQRCAAIDAPQLRESFCVGVPANARLLELCLDAQVQ